MRTDLCSEELNETEEGLSDGVRVSEASNSLDLLSVLPGSNPPPKELSDRTIQLYEEHAAGLLRYATILSKDRATAQDAVQETFLRFLVFRSHGQTVENEKAWLYRVLKNYLLDRMKASSERNRVDLEEIAELTDRRQNPEDDCQQSEAWQQLEILLSPRELECLRLRAEGFDYAEIAGIMDVQTGTIGAMLARALKKSRKIFHPLELPLAQRGLQRRRIQLVK